MAAYGNDRPWDWNSLDHSSAATILARRWPGATQASLEPFGSGDFTLAFRQNHQVIRVARHTEAAEALKREACVLAKSADRLPLPVPRPVYYAVPGCPPFTVHDEIVGEILTREEWENLPSGARERAASELAAFMKALHSLPVELGLACGLPKIGLPEFARSLRRKIAGSIHGRLDRQTQARLAEALETWSLPSPFENQPSALLHCDLGPGHVLYDSQTGRLRGVIDFGDLAIGDPARDFIYIYEDFGPMILEEVLARYGGNDDSLTRSGIRKWYLLEATSWTVEMFRLGRHSEIEHGLAEIRRELADF
jgi:aminoglycoside phosphotransferase (APT) family kinase protein